MHFLPDYYFRDVPDWLIGVIADAIVETISDNIDILYAAYQAPPLRINGSQLRKFKKRQKVLFEVFKQRIKRKP